MRNAKVQWEDGRGNPHTTMLLATFSYESEWYVVTPHPNAAFQPVLLRVTLFDKTWVEAEPIR